MEKREKTMSESSSLSSECGRECAIAGDNYSDNSKSWSLSNRNGREMAAQTVGIVMSWVMVKVRSLRIKGRLGEVGC